MRCTKVRKISLSNQGTLESFKFSSKSALNCARNLHVSQMDGLWIRLPVRGRQIVQEKPIQRYIVSTQNLLELCIQGDVAAERNCSSL
jgi:hypothetical protein